MKNEKNEKSIFSDGTYTVWSNSNINVGDPVELTTSELDFDAVDGIFEPTTRCFEVDVEIIGEDLSDHIPEKSNNGGAYGYALAEVLSVEEVVE